MGKSTINGHFQLLFWHNQRVNDFSECIDLGARVPRRTAQQRSCTPCSTEIGVTLAWLCHDSVGIPGACTAWNIWHIWHSQKHPSDCDLVRQVSEATNPITSRWVAMVRAVAIRLGGWRVESTRRLACWGGRLPLQTASSEPRTAQDPVNWKKEKLYKARAKFHVF